MTSILLAAQEADLEKTLIMLGVTIGAVFILVAGQVAIFRKFYRIPPPDTAIVRTGHGGFTVSTGSGLFVIPLLHFFEYMNLAAHRFDLSGTQLDSDQARSLQLPNIFQVAIGQEEEMLHSAAQRLNLSQGYDLLVKDIIFDEYERLLAQLDNSASEDSPANRFIEGIEEALNKVGLTIIACHRQ